FILAWPNARYAVMGSDQAADTLFIAQQKSGARRGEILEKEEEEKRHAEIRQLYEIQTDIRYAAARGWVDAIIAPDTTRDILIQLLEVLQHAPLRAASFHTGVIQV
ncbi:MAG: carboxyl transferase domain-containing protein, partial [Acidobacteriota bacterium]